MSLLSTHLGFLEALRTAGLSVSLAEGLDAVQALGSVGWQDRALVRDVYAATLVKRQTMRPTFDALFDLYFPPLVGAGINGEQDDTSTSKDDAAALEDFRARLEERLAGDEDDAAVQELAREAMARFGHLPGRGRGLSAWSSYTTLQRVAPGGLVDRIVAALLADNPGEPDEPAAARRAARRIGRFTTLVEEEARRRIAEEKGPEQVAQVAVRPAIDRLDFTAARKSDVEAMRREIYPLARRLATRLTQERHARRRGPLDFRRTVRASMSTGGVPLVTHHRPRRPHRTELVVLCDVSGSVANFAQFTLLLVFALREQFAKVRAFTFVDHVTEVTEHFAPGADVVDVMTDLAVSTTKAALWGRTNYGRAFAKFEESHPDALGPKSSLLILGDARSNYSDLNQAVLKRLAGRARHAYWLNPEHTRQWGTGDSAAREYGEIVAMFECRNLTQLGRFVHDVV